MLVKEINITDILIDDNFNCRGAFTPFDVADLAKSIERDGLLQPVVVCELPAAEQAAIQKQYKLIAGFRRTYAHKVLKKPTIFATITGFMTGADARVLNLKENIDRKDLNMLQEAQALKALKDAGVPQEDIAIRLGVSRGWVQNRFCLLDLPEPIQKDAAAGVLTQYQIKTLAGKSEDMQYSLVKKIKEAKEKGERTDVIITRAKPKNYERKRRQPHEQQEMLDVLLDTVGSCLATRILAWVLGNVSDLELLEDIKKFHPDKVTAFNTKMEELKANKQ